MRVELLPRRRARSARRDGRRRAHRRRSPPASTPGDYRLVFHPPSPFFRRVELELALGRATTTSRSSSRRTRARATAAAERRRARRAVQRAHRLVERLAARRRPARRARRGGRPGARRSPPRPRRSRRTRRSASRRPSSAARSAAVLEELARLNRGVRGAVRLPLRRLREPAPARRARPGPARAARAHARGRARHRAAGARRDRPRPLAARMTGAVLDPYLTDWLDLLLRWLHVIAAIVWIGTSFYFVAARQPAATAEEPRGRAAGRRRRGVGDPRRRLLPRPEVPRRPAHAARAPALVQVGGVHDVALRLRADRRPLLLQRGHVPRRPGRRRPGHRLGDRDQRRLLGAAWLVYDGLCRLLEGHELVLAACIVGAHGRGRLGLRRAVRAARRIPPGRRDARDDHGRERLLRDHPRPPGADPREGGRARAGLAAGTASGKQRSVHNNYLTLPVLLTMLARPLPVRVRGRRGRGSSCSCSCCSAPGSGCSSTSATPGRNHWSIPVTAALAVVVLAWVIRPGRRAGRCGAGSASRSRRCSPSSSSAARRATPSTPRRTASRARRPGVVLDTAEQIERQADAIESRGRRPAMPLGNVTGMTDEERDAAWIAWARQ